FVVAFSVAAVDPAIRTHVLREGYEEYKEYIFLLPLFLSVALLAKLNFFASSSRALSAAAETSGRAQLAIAQFGGSTVLSAFLDNNVVADFASRALLGMER